jgi:hypothetical protein
MTASGLWAESGCTPDLFHGSAMIRRRAVDKRLQCLARIQNAFEVPVV